MRPNWDPSDLVWTEFIAAISKVRGECGRLGHLSASVEEPSSVFRIAADLGWFVCRWDLCFRRNLAVGAWMGERPDSTPL
jgi:hypothetical protein